ncbi:MAG: uncharacterized protein KVP18_003767 [Porospora cf. gigantea A]|uniref:uncharacterized protein n=1 Tax=Porospora cf. gigantea A TaxID=2853593 RepID=UPI00355990D6|nr:MAG: hypothetical protein KVP18_003767 [Porospora cf. gigantea A]
MKYQREPSLLQFKKKLVEILLNRFANRCFPELYACLGECGFQKEVCDWADGSWGAPHLKLADDEPNVTHSTPDNVSAFVPSVKQATTSTQDKGSAAVSSVKQATTHSTQDKGSAAVPSVKQATRRSRSQSDSSLSCDESDALSYTRRRLSGRQGRRRNSLSDSLSTSNRWRRRGHPKVLCRSIEESSSWEEDELLVEPNASGIYRYFQKVSAMDVDSNVLSLLRVRRRRLEELDAQRDIMNKKIEVAILERAQSLEQARPKKWIRDGCPQMKKRGSLR